MTTDDRPKKIITKQQWLEAFALFTLAHQHYAKMREFERAMLRVIPEAEEHEGYGGCLSDAIYTDGSASFDEAIEKQGFLVEADR